MEDQYTQLLLRMPVQLKAALQREANVQGRKLTQEVNIRLRESLKPPAPGIAPVPPSYIPGPIGHGHQANEKSPDYPLTGIDQAMLDVFRSLPPEKQLALLSLFR